MIRDICAGVPSLGRFVEGGGGTVDIVYDEFDISIARRHMMVMKIVIGAHRHLLVVLLDSRWLKRLGVLLQGMGKLSAKAPVAPVLSWPETEDPLGSIAVPQGRFRSVTEQCGWVCRVHVWDSIQNETLSIW